MGLFHVNPLFQPSDGGLRVLIIGNSGSGKSTLANLIAAQAWCQVTSMDSIYWEHQASLRKRGQADAIAMACDKAAASNWVFEGVFGWLADCVAPRATALVWLDLPWEDCRAGLLARGPQSGEDAKEFAGLVNWAEAYWTRGSGSSQAGHARIYAAFAGAKVICRTRSQVGTLLERVSCGCQPGR